MIKYFLVTCERGHCGSGNTSYIKFAFEAKTMMDAVDMAKRMPSVKHTKMCVNAREIDIQEYKEYREINAYERYEQHKSSYYKKGKRR